MPLYATRCTACDHRKDVLVRTTTSPLPLCNRERPEGPCEGRLERALSAPSFHLKGSGWYGRGCNDAFRS